MGEIERYTKQNHNVSRLLDHRTKRRLFVRFVKNVKVNHSGSKSLHLISHKFSPASANEKGLVLCVSCGGKF